MVILSTLSEEHGNETLSCLFQFYFMLNVAVGGTTGFFSDEWTNANGAKPWSNESPQAMLDFWNARGDWEPTWVGNDIAMAVDYIRVWGYDTSK